MAEALAESGGLRRGASTARLVGTAFEKVRAGAEDTVPESYWSVRPAPPSPSDDGEDAEDEEGDAVARLDAGFVLFSGTLRAMLKDLGELLGGIAKPV